MVANLLILIANLLPYLEIYIKELTRPTRVRMNKVIRLAIIYASVPYMIVGASGYLMFANQSEELTSDSKAGIIIMSDYGGRFEVLLSQLFLGISITASIPFCTKPSKDALSVLLNLEQ